MRRYIVAQSRQKDGLASKLTLSERLALETLASVGSSTIGKFAAMLGSPESQVSRQVDALVNKGLVSRRRSTEDRRVVNISLTPEGEELVRTLEAEEIEQYLFLAKMFSGEGAAHLRSSLVDVLDVIIKGLDFGASRGGVRP